MDLWETVIEKIPSLRWRKYELITQTIYKKVFSHIGKGSVIIAPLKLVGVAGISLGNNVNILEGAWLQTERGGRIDIGDNTYVGHRSHIHAVENVSIGSGCVFADNVMINTGEHTIGDLWDISSKGPIIIGNDVFIGQNVSILSGVTIGDGAVIGTSAVVNKSVPAGAVVGGIPAKVLREKNISPHRTAGAEGTA